MIGSGNVAFHLHLAFQEAKHVVLKQLVGRRLDGFESFNPSIPRTLIGNEIAQADIYVVAVSDTAVEGVFEKLSGQSGIVVHTSGALVLETSGVVQRTGVFYPLQTFSKSRRVQIKEIPLFIEAENLEDLKVLQALATAIGTHPIHSNPKTRLAAHLAAVFANNFANHMIYLAQEICAANKLDQGLLDPLMQETFLKLQSIAAKDAQTGPARRKDYITQDAHKQLLNQESLLDLYSLISKSIETTYEKKL